MKVYLALDCSSNLYSSSYNERALKIICGLVADLSLNGIDLDLVEFSKTPKILKHSARTDQDVKEIFPLNTSRITTGAPDFLQLRNLILNDNITNDYELILIMEARYNWIPVSFHLPCPIHFILLADIPNSISSKFILELRSISLEFCPEEEADPLIIYTDQDINMAIKRLLQIQRLQHELSISLTDELKITVTVMPGISKSPISSYDGQLFRSIANHSSDDQNTIKLIGFTKSQNLLNIASSSFVHIVKPADKWEIYHTLTEVLGAEGMVGILQHTGTGEEYALKPFRDDPSKLWLLCLQLIPPTTHTWKPINITNKIAQFPEISYKMSATPQIHWEDQHGIQSDLQKLHRFLKKTDRIEQFYQEVQRISNNAIAFGYHNFASVFADVLEARCINIPPESKAHMSRVTELLRKGGFKLVRETKLIM